MDSIVGIQLRGWCCMMSVFFVAAENVWYFCLSCHREPPRVHFQDAGGCLIFIYLFGRGEGVVGHFSPCVNLRVKMYTNNACMEPVISRWAFMLWHNEGRVQEDSTHWRGFLVFARRYHNPADVWFQRRFQQHEERKERFKLSIFYFIEVY